MMLPGDDDLEHRGMVGPDDPAWHSGIVSDPGERIDDRAAGSFVEILAELEDDPDQCWLAMEGLHALELDVREAIIEELALHVDQPGITRLLGLLASSSDDATRRLASGALEDCPTDEPRAVGHGHAIVPLSNENRPAAASVRMERCLVTPMNGDGRGWVVVSTSHHRQRRTAAFLCDINEGVVDVFGDVEADTELAGGLLEQVRLHASLTCAIDDPDLSLGLLAGSLSLNPHAPTRRIRDWLEGTLGRAFQPSAFVVMVPPLEADEEPEIDDSIARAAQSVLEACPSWLDCSPLTSQLAEEISLREAHAKADPERDAGAYRFLFEHRLIDRLDLYRRMLWWMAGLWNSSGEKRLSRSALLLAAQLSNEQFAVPSHPFTVQLTTRSLRTAQARLRTSSSSLDRS